MTTDVDTIFPTIFADHQNRGLPYVVVVHPAAHQSIGGRHWGILETTLAEGERLHVVVHVKSDRTGRLTAGQARMDQTVRTALGLLVLLTEDGARVEVCLVPLTVGIADSMRNAASRLVGRRYLLLRVAQPDPNDIEKGVARVPLDDLAALGADIAGRLVYFAANRTEKGYRLTRASLQALPLDGATLADRRHLEDQTAEEGWAARYRSAPALLGIEGPDLAPSFIDRDARVHLGIDRAWPVLVRRDSRSAIARELQEFGVALLASLLAIGGVIEPILDDWGVAAAPRGLIVLMIAIGVALTLVILKLRSDLR